MGCEWRVENIWPKWILENMIMMRIFGPKRDVNGEWRIFGPRRVFENRILRQIFGPKRDLNGE